MIARDPLTTKPFMREPLFGTEKGLPRPWIKRAKCLGDSSAPDFFPESTQSGRDQSARDLLIWRAWTYCTGAGSNTPCRALDECYWWAVKTGQHDGMWGGVCFDDHTRKKDRKKKSIPMKVEAS